MPVEIPSTEAHVLASSIVRARAEGAEVMSMDDVIDDQPRGLVWTTSLLLFAVAVVSSYVGVAEFWSSRELRIVRVGAMLAMASVLMTPAPL